MASVIKYRNDIDGLRAIAVLAVIIGHMGYLPYGYLGVDIFFAISGFLITTIVYNEALNSQFSIIKFYLRRIRRIIPLVVFTTIIALIFGLFVLLPADLKNISQAVFATNFFSNNIVQLITSASYWDLSNDYKPLMHTWSLAVEEQFYLLFPIIFFMFKGKNIKYILPLLTVLTIVSFVCFLTSYDEHQKFYLIQYRFYELSLGGIAAIFFKEKKFNQYYSLFFLIVILSLLVFKFNNSADIHLILIVVASVGLLVTGNNNNKITKYILENKAAVFIGKVSFSLYMWHQIVLAYTRYIFINKIGILEGIVLLIVIIILSQLTYTFIEQPFRNKEKIKTKSILIILSVLTILSSILSLYLYKVKGVIKDVPELGVYKNDKFNDKGYDGQDYNNIIFNYDKAFSNNKKIKVLVIGDSYARDFSNILLESNYGEEIELSYTKDIYLCKDVQKRINSCDYLFFSTLNYKTYKEFKKKFIIVDSKVWNVGVKNFGWKNGIFYNQKRDSSYCIQRTEMKENILVENKLLLQDWGDKYINLIDVLVDENGKVPVFTPDCKFISHDCLHLTQPGAEYISEILDLSKIFEKKQ